LREARFLSQEDLAERAGVSRATIYKAEGGSGVSPKTGRALADALAVEPEDLLDPKGLAPPLFTLESSGEEGRRGLYLTTVLEDVRSSISAAQWLISSEPEATQEALLGRFYLASSLQSRIYAAAQRWETRVLAPLAHEEMPTEERHQLDEIRTAFGTAERLVSELLNKVGGEFEEHFDAQVKAEVEEFIASTRTAQEA
jgi:transcriptional regulator with XRE-family HTH domain